jgi:photosystem II stability/assembly factor-like uncharacterized protein
MPNFIQRQSSRLLSSGLLMTLSLSITLTLTAQVPQTFRHIGPGVNSGRTADIEVDNRNPRNIYVGASTGGVFKSGDWGKTWTPIFDEAGLSLAIGDMAICDSNPDLIWVGTGEASGEQAAASVGDGVYKSTDGGKSWKCMGLKKTRHISKIQINPLNSDIVYVAATGARWGNNEDRGVFRTLNGGKSWEKVLYINDYTGISDLVAHPDGKTLFAAAWQQYRNAWAHLQRGPSSALYRSEDGGNTWQKLTDGFSKDTLGRIALAFAPSKPDLIYACVESKEGGFYRSDNKGTSWELMSTKPSTSYWYGRIYVHPTDENNAFVMGVMVQETRDGGKTFMLMETRKVHVDHHNLWIDPTNTLNRLLGNDGGVYQTQDGGKKWSFYNNLFIGQYYAITVDQENPYRIFGGKQDNGVWGGPVSTPDGKITPDSLIYNISGGDGFWSAVDPTNPAIAYGESQYGGIVRYDFRTDKGFGVQPKSPDRNNRYRFNWNAPFIISTHPPHPIYLGGNILHQSNNQGEDWKEISPDLSRAEELKDRTIMGMKPVLKPYASITALAESPFKPGVIYIGTDDGNLQMTSDGGKTWINLSDRLPMPSDRFFTRLVCSANEVGTVYAACARYYEANDLKPYLFRSTDFGQTWVSLTAKMPEEAVIRGFAEHQLHPEWLYCGIHNGLLISSDGGRNWKRAPGLIPVAIDDIKIQMPTGDLVLGSYGRGIIIGKF